jgi:asparagine synthase (glutamine-hydrolysing)
MCGIVGLAAPHPISEGDHLQRMSETIRHRGPDDAGLWWSRDRRVGLAMRRLAIIDLSPGGHQPMQDTTASLTIVFNGEIYNFQSVRRELEALGHAFRTASDTEVILEAFRQWGTDCVAHLNGMFAFCVFDASAQRLFLARDRAGEKPLYYTLHGGRFGFASELKSLMADPAFPRELDREATNYYLAFGYVPGSLCILKGVRKLPQGHALTYDLGTGMVRSWRYWDVPEPDRLPLCDAEELTGELERLLLDSVRLRLIADVPVGILLSGGIDSSLVAAMAVRASSRPVKTFTVSFPGHGSYDEAVFARQVSRHLGTEHVELEAEPATWELLPRLARQFDEPIADSSMVPTFLVSRLIRQHATVALGGDGGDELFGGYLHYGWLERQQRLRRHLPGFMRALLGKTAARALPIGFRGRNYLLGLTDGLPTGIAHVNLYFDADIRRRLFKGFWNPDESNLQAPENYKASLCDSRLSALQQATRVDFRTYLVDDILVKVDRASMLTSLEVRAPWLDHRIVEFAFQRVPDSLRATGSERKVLPRHLAARLLPADMDLSRKQGFSIPLRRWLNNGWGSVVRDVLGPADCLFDRKTMASVFAAQERGHSNEQRLFALTMFELWRREYRIVV